MQSTGEIDRTIDQVTQGPGALKITWSDGAKSEFHYIWLRDNCRCATCGEPSTGRRQLRLTELPLDVAPESVIQTPGGIRIFWTDGHQSNFNRGWLDQNRYDLEARKDRAFVPPVWTDGTRRNPPTLKFDGAANSDAVFLQMLAHIRDSGICFLQNAPAVEGVLEAFAQKTGPIQESNFGRVQNLVVDQAKQSVAHRTVALKPHTDEPYRASPPGIIMFHCIETDAAGAGASLFMDGFELAHRLRDEDPDGFSAISRHPCVFRRHFAGDVDLIAQFPVISLDAFGNVCGVRVNDRVAAPVCVPPQDVRVYYRGLRKFLNLAEDENLAIKRTLQPGDIAVFDNHRILHGRTEISMKNRRFLQWLQVERGDFHSRMRVLADKLGRPRGSEPLLKGAY